MTQYYDTVESIRESSNYVNKCDETAFANFDGNKAAEVKHIRQTLQKELRWRTVSTLMQFQLKFTVSGLALKNAVNEAFELCELLENSPQACLKFRSVIIKKHLAAILSSIAPPWSSSVTQGYTATLQRITPSSYSRWEDFTLTIAFDAAKARVLESNHSDAEKLDQLTQLIRTAEEQMNYAKANETYISRRDFVKSWFEKVQGTSEASTVLQSLRSVQKSYIVFHEQKARLAYFEAAAVSDYLATLYVRYHEYSNVLETVETFEQTHPKFQVPLTQERLYHHAITAARHLGLVDKHKEFQKVYRGWMMKCSFIKQGGGLTDEAISDPSYAFRVITSTGDDLVEWGSNAVKVMLRWAGHEWNKDLLSAEDCKLLFVPELGQTPQGNIAEYLENNSAAIADSILRTRDRLVSSDVFRGRYQKLLDWVLIPDRLPSRSARLFALRILVQSRLFRVRNQFIKVGEVPSAEQAANYQDESEALSEVEKLEAVEYGNSAEQENREKMTWIDTTLARSFVPNAGNLGLIDDSELALRADQCRELITQYQKNGDLLREYHAILQIIRLTWQRFFHFKSVLPEAVMPFVEEAEKVFTKTRSLITSLDPPEDLVARVKLSQDFSHREHYNFALAGCYTAFESYVARASQTPTQELLGLASQNYEALLLWAFRSKGRGFSDMLGLETGVVQTIETIKSTLQQKPQGSLEGDGHGNDQALLDEVELKMEATSLSSPQERDPMSGPIISKKQIDEMLQCLPEGVVIVDFIDVRYSTSTTIIAMIYRKGQTNFPTRISSLSMVFIQRWIKENLDLTSEEQRRRLLSTEYEAKLSELSGLLEPLIKTLPAVAIKPSETVIFCPTGLLNRIPLHAIPIDGMPFIERNPVAYCQSLTILHHLFLRSHSHQTSSLPSKATVINPMPETHKDGTPVLSTPLVSTLATSLTATFHHGLDLTAFGVSSSIHKSSILHYHGHISYPFSPLESAMVLNAKAYESLSKPSSSRFKSKGSEYIPAKDMFKFQLREPALATIVGCGSGLATISSMDDVLGIATALFWAGAQAVVGTLWSIDDEDGGFFGKEFYAAIWEELRRGDVVGGDGGDGQGIVDLARAMQRAVVKLREMEGKRATYHWAAFVLNGFWLLPRDVLLGS